eukprot:tig00020553_g10669.t1
MRLPPKSPSIRGRQPPPPSDAGSDAPLLQGRPLDPAALGDGAGPSTRPQARPGGLGARRVVNVVGRLGMEDVPSIAQLEEIARRRSPESPPWLDFEAPTIADMDFVERLFELHPVTTEDCFAADVHEKVEHFDEYVFVSLAVIVTASGPGAPSSTPLPDDSLHPARSLAQSAHPRISLALHPPVGGARRDALRDVGAARRASRAVRRLFRALAARAQARRPAPLSGSEFALEVKPVRTAALHIVLMEDAVLSFHRDSLGDLLEHRVLDRLRALRRSAAAAPAAAAAHAAAAAELSAEALTYAILDTVADSIAPPLAAVEEEAEAIGREIVSGSGAAGRALRDTVLRRIMLLRRRIDALKGLLDTKCEVTGALLTPSADRAPLRRIAAGGLAPYVRDVHSKLEGSLLRANAAADSLRSAQVSNQDRLQLELAESAAKTNYIMRCTALVGPVVFWHTLVSGMFSQNIDIPYQTDGGSDMGPFGLILAEIIISTALLLAVFKYKKWL